jgi:hypothetical protein
MSEMKQCPNCLSFGGNRGCDTCRYMSDARCSICERQFQQDELKEADDFDPQGNHRYLNICEECEDGLDKVGVTFDFR